MTRLLTLLAGLLTCSSARLLSGDDPDRTSWSNAVPKETTEGTGDGDNFIIGGDDVAPGALMGTIRAQPCAVGLSFMRISL
jgi:hypothetical protein